MKHTPELWKSGKDGIVIEVYKEIETGFVEQSIIGKFDTEDQAIRAVLCVNALAGIENPAEWVATAKEIKQKYFAATAELLADGFEALDRYGLLGEFRNENKEVLDRFTKILRGLEMRPSSGLFTRAKELMGGQDE